MIRNFEDLCNALFAKTDSYQAKFGCSTENLEAWKAHSENDPEMKFLRKVWKTYNRAKDNAEKFGFVGVGCISFAEGRVVRYQERLARKLA